MEFDGFSVILLSRNPQFPQLSPEAEASLQDAHMAHLADMHEAGFVLAAGPLVSNAPDEPLVGLMLLTVGVDQARELESEDPAVVAGRLEMKVLPWLVPAGAVNGTRTKFPRSMAEAADEVLE